MPILPKFALFVILHSWSLVLQLVSAVWYEQQLSRYRHHWLVQLHHVADLSHLEQVCTGFHAHNGLGAPVIHTSPRLVRALLVKYLRDLSLRQTEEMIDNHILTKWFVGYHLFEAPLDHSTLDRFELWLFRHHPRLFFDEIIRMIDQLCPEDRQRLQMVDTFALHARAANTYLIELLRDICRHSLCRLAEVDPDRHLALLAQLNLLALFGAPGEKITPALDAKERAERLQRVGQQAWRLLRLLNDSLDQAPCLPPDDQAPLRLLLSALDKIISDETTLTANNPDDPDDVTIVERQHGKKGEYRIGSASDLDASYRKNHHDAQAILGYNPAILSTKVFVRETHLATGAEPDNVGLPTVLQNQFDYHGFFPAQLAGDMAYGHGKTRALIEQLTGGQTQIIALVPDYNQRSARFNPRDFTLSDDGLSLTCPNGKSTSRCYSHKSEGSVGFRFPAKLCRDCPFWDKCRGPDGNKSAHRQVFISFYRDQIETAQDFNQSDTFKQGIKQRMNVERLIFCLTNIHGARHAHSYGQQRTDFQLKMQATAFNLRQLVREMIKKRGPDLADPPAGGALRPVAA
jgi:transposase